MDSRACAKGILAVAVFGLAGSSVRPANVPLPDTPYRGVVPGAFPARPDDLPRSVPEDIATRKDHLTLVDVLDIALRNDPKTEIAWRDARAHVDALGVARADYWPDLTLTASATRAKTAVQGGQFTLTQTTYGPGAALTYVVLDFGERSGNVKSASSDALEAVWTHGATVQATVLSTIEAYVAYVDAKAQLVAARTSETETATGLDAAEQKRGAGLATIADVLQGRTQHSQATLLAQTIEGSIGRLRGALATSMGLPANARFDVGDLPAEVPAVDFGGSVDSLIDEALAKRPDLAAAREAWLASKADITAKRGEWLPKLNLTGSINRNYYDPQIYASHTDVWAVGLMLRIPIFTGFQAHYEVAQAREDERKAAAEARLVEQTVIDDVWANWYDMKTAAQRIDTSKDLLASATQSQDVALGRYKEGVGSLLDLLNAQSALALARAQEISARADWFVAAARLLYSTGRLTGPEAIPR